jgi:hypothetical protein
LDVISEEQLQQSMNKLNKLGLDAIRTREFQVISTRTPVDNAFVLNASYYGTDSDLECLRWLTQVEFARLEGPTITAEALKHVIKLPHLKRLQLAYTTLRAADLEVLVNAPDLDLLEVIYAPFGDEAVDVLNRIPVWGNLYLFGTQLTVRGQQYLKSKFDGADLTIARGGFLGIMCPPTSTEISETVKDGAAQKAGLFQNDKIQSINGVPVSVFDDVRRELANYAEGDVVTLQIFRRSEGILSKEVTLGRRKESQRFR